MSSVSKGLTVCSAIAFSERNSIAFDGLKSPETMLVGVRLWLSRLIFV